jgi:anti-anti-sigma factor
MAEVAGVLTLAIEDFGTYAVVVLAGRLVSGSADLLYRPVVALLPTHKRVVLDLCDLTHMDSMGLGTLVRLVVAAKTRGSTIELRNLGRKVRELLIMTNLLPVFTVVGEHDIRM